MVNPLFFSFLLALPFVLGIQGRAHQARQRHQDLRVAKPTVVEPESARNDTVQLHKRFSNSKWSLYDTEESGNPGACGQHIKNSQFAVSMNKDQYNINDCFKTITLKWKGKTAQAQIMDKCLGCPYGGIDLSIGLFHFFEPRGIDVGILWGEWDFADAAPSEPKPKPEPKPEAKPDPPKSTPKTGPTESSSAEPKPSSILVRSSSSASFSASPAPTSSSAPPTPNIANLADFNQLILQFVDLIVVGASLPHKIKPWSIATEKPVQSTANDWPMMYYSVALDKPPSGSAVYTTMIGYHQVSSSQVSRSGSRSSSTTAPATAIALAPQKLDEPIYRTLGDVQEQAAQEISVRCITKGETVDGVRIGVYLSVSTNDNGGFLRLVAKYVAEQLRLSSYIFVLASATTSNEPTPTTLIVIASSDELAQRGILLVSSKFVGRIASSTRESLKQWSALVDDLGGTSYDDKALWDVVRKSARQPIDPLLPPPGSRSIDQMLSDARAKLQRINATEAWRELRENQVSAPTFLVDIRPREQRQKHGGIHGSLVIERNVLEWRLDPRSDSRLAIADRYDLRVIVFCQEGYTSSLATYALQQLGLLNATDIIGGFEAWKFAGLPIDTDAERPQLRSLASLAGSVV